MFSFFSLLIRREYGEDEIVEKENKRNFKLHKWQKKHFFCFAPAAGDFRWMTIIITTVGLVTLLSASYPAAIAKTGDPYFYVKRQFRYIILGLTLMEAVSHLNYQILRKWAKALLI